MTVGKLWAKADSRRRMGGGKFIIVLRTSRNTEVNNNHANTTSDNVTSLTYIRLHVFAASAENELSAPTTLANEPKRHGEAQRGTHTLRS